MAQALFDNSAQFVDGVGMAPACPAERKGGSDNHREANLACRSKSLL